MIAETLDALDEARQQSGASESEVLFGGIEQELEKLLPPLMKAYLRMHRERVVRAIWKTRKSKWHLVQQKS